MNQIMQTLIESIESDIERESQWIVVHDIIASLLKEKWEGKRLNRRIADQVKEKLTALYGKEPIVSYEVDGTSGFGSARLNIWNTPHWEYGSRNSFYLAHNSRPSEPKYKGHWFGEVHAEGFEYMDICHGSAAKERNVERAKLLKNTKTLDELSIAILAVKEGWGKIQLLTDKLDSPAHQVEYTAERLTGLKEDYDAKKALERK